MKEAWMSAEPSSDDVAEILEQLRESVREQRGQGSADALFAAVQSVGGAQWKPLLNKLEETQQVNPHLPIAWPEWPPGIVPKAVALIQKVTRRLLRWYINPIVEQQNIFNQMVTETLSETLSELTAQVELTYDYANRVEERQKAFHQEATERDNQLEDELRMITSRAGLLSQRLRRLEQQPGTISTATAGAEAAATGAPGESTLVSEGPDYFMLELKYRGAPELIKERQAIYVPYFEGRRAVLDIGCGRGEFVELLREKGIEARGIDLDADAVAYCQERGLPVTEAEATAYLRGLKDGALDGIFMAQVAEHLTPATLQTLLSLAFAKLAPGGVLVAETINPLCIYALVNHYLIDPSHVRPLHPELLKFMVESAGFSRTHRKRKRSESP
jgi:2-polyprenyl-3-methyl-5-hydroxy-6-metoxy-1,4-benzoquinol methylase